jgi:tetratricopeptide (TPR) repeat protein
LLHETARPELTLTLWLYLRAVLLWLDTKSDARADLFGGFPQGVPHEDETGALAHPLSRLRALVEYPEQQTAVDLAAACVDVSEWAAAVGRENTEREFAEAAAYLMPGDADTALFAGRAARRSGDFARAEHWYKRAVGIARRAHDKEAHVLAVIRLGTLAEEQGLTTRARDRQWRAWRLGRQFKLDKLSAYARHELLVIAIYAGTFDEANEHAAIALQLYGRFDDRFPQLAHDTAFLWAHYGYFSAALPIYEAVLPYLARAPERIQVVANVGRAAAACGDAGRFYWAWDEADKSLGEAGEHTATALLNLAYGARTLGLRTQARELAERGLKAARERGLRIVEERLSTLLNELRTTLGGDADRESTPTMTEIAARFIARLGRGEPA